MTTLPVRTHESLPTGRPIAGPSGVAPAGPAAQALPAIIAALAAGMAALTVLGPLGLAGLTYRTSPTTLNQLEGSDAAALLVVAPLTVVAAVLAWRRHPAGPMLAAGVSAFALYTYTQVVVGQEYLRLPGNVERFFPLFLTVFVLAEAGVVLAWRALPADLPAPSPGVERTAAVALLLVALFLVGGLHLPSILAAWRDPASLTEYASSPTPFWLVKLMDLGIVVPAALACGVGLWRHRSWARRAAYVLLVAYTCVGLSVASMAIVMLAHGDPDASAGLAAGFGAFALVFVAVSVALVRPLFAHRDSRPEDHPE